MPILDNDTPTIALEKRPQDFGYFRVNTPTLLTPAFLTLEQLQTLVQAAYDDHGIIAAPSYDLEATESTGSGYLAELAARGVL